jgi:hypothetical protein
MLFMMMMMMMVVVVVVVVVIHGQQNSVWIVRRKLRAFDLGKSQSCACA